MVAVVVGFIATDTLHSQLRSEKLQQARAEADLCYRKQRVRVALDVLLAGLQRQAWAFTAVPHVFGVIDDIFAPLRPLESEAAWLPDCDWKTEFLALVHVTGASGAARAKITEMTNTIKHLDVGSSVYQACRNAIEAMQ